MKTWKVPFLGCSSPASLQSPVSAVDESLEADSMSQVLTNEDGGELVLRDLKGMWDSVPKVTVTPPPACLLQSLDDSGSLWYAVCSTGCHVGFGNHNTMIEKMLLLGPSPLCFNLNALAVLYNQINYEMSSEDE